MKRFLNGDAAAELLEKHGMSVLRWKSVGHDALLRTAWELGYPLVVKRVCEDGGSVLQVVNSENEMRAVLATLSFKSREDGGSIYVQRKPEGKEVAVGFVSNEGYAPAVSLGLGGIFSSILKEVAYASAPITEDDVVAMIRDIEAEAVLESGVLSQLIDSVVRISQIGTEKKEIIEMDIKLVLHEKGALTVDASIIVG